MKPLTTEEARREKGPLIGLSLSRCLHDVAAGLIDEARVTEISMGGYAPNPKAFGLLVNEYADTAWAGMPGAPALATAFYEAGRIDQPVLRGELPLFIQILERIGAADSDKIWLAPTLH